jgi:hypothetical protein
MVLANISLIIIFEQVKMPIRGIKEKIPFFPLSGPHFIEKISLFMAKSTFSWSFNCKVSVRDGNIYR